MLSVLHAIVVNNTHVINVIVVKGATLLLVIC
jgi:hypothetical protein